MDALYRKVETLKAANEETQISYEKSLEEIQKLDEMLTKKQQSLEEREEKRAHMKDVGVQGEEDTLEDNSMNDEYKEKVIRMVDAEHE